MSSNKSLVQQQFGDKAAAYATSAVHAQGASLARVVELLQPQPQWQVLDVATAAGHTAHALAPHVGHVVATDLTFNMLPKARQLAAERGLTRETFSAADAEALPFADGVFDGVLCRIAPHHFPDVPRFVREAARVLRPQGWLVVVDNIVPDVRGRKKKEREAQSAAGDYINAFEKLRDPSHGRCLSVREWQQLFTAAGLLITHTETAAKAMEFTDWAARMQVSTADTIRLRAMLIQAPPLVQQFLTPSFAGDKIDFHLYEAIVIGKKNAYDLSVVDRLAKRTRQFGSANGVIMVGDDFDELLEDFSVYY